MTNVFGLGALSMVCCVAMSALPAHAVEDPLTEYVKRADPAFTYKQVSETDVAGTKIRLVKFTSQRWRKQAWWHWLAIVEPPQIRQPDQALLVIGGGSNRRDEPPNMLANGPRMLVGAAVASQSIIAVVMQVPNQPLLGDKYEDQIIAHTFDQFLRTGDKSWPLLLPMTKSGVKAMDVVQAVLKEKADREVERFVVAGASKRGWTTYLTAAVDDRVVAIAPMVIDMLNLPEQLPHQHRTLGRFRDLLEPYTELNLPERLDTPRGRELVAMVDPYAYRDRIRVPKLVMLGTNDKFWVTDAANLYFDGLAGKKWLNYTPNAGHGLNGSAYLQIGSFMTALGNGGPAKLTWKRDENGSLIVETDAEGASAMLWQATSDDRDFSDNRWTSRFLGNGTRWTVDFETPTQGWQASYVQVMTPVTGAMPLHLCTPMTILPNTFPGDSE